MRLIDADALRKDFEDAQRIVAGTVRSLVWGSAIVLLRDAPTVKHDDGMMELQAENARLKAERDAAVKDLKNAADDNGGCYGCKWLDDVTEKCTNEIGKIECDCKTNNMWQWRGVSGQKEN